MPNPLYTDTRLNQSAHLLSSLFQELKLSEVIQQTMTDFDQEMSEFMEGIFKTSCKEDVLFWMEYASCLTNTQLYELLPDRKPGQIRHALVQLVRAGKVVRLEPGVHKFGPAYSSDNAGDGPGILGLLMMMMVMALDKAFSMINAAVGRRIWRARDRELRDYANWAPAWFVWCALTLQHKTGRTYFRGAVKQLGKQFSSNNAGDGPVRFSQSFLNDDCWRRIMHWELMMAVEAREERRQRDAVAAVPKIQALARGWLVRHQWDMDIFAVGALEDLVHSGYSNDEVAAMADWHPFAWDWFVKERAAWAEDEAGWREDGGYDAWGEQVNPLDVSMHGRESDWEYSDSEEENIPPNPVLGDFLFGPEFSSDNSGDGPPRAQVPSSPTSVIPPSDFIMEQDDLVIFHFRFENIVEAFDLQVWTYEMRLYPHEYLGQPFDHHESYGSTDMFNRLTRFRTAIGNHLMTGGGPCIIEYDDWDEIIRHLETLELADFFHDDQININVRSMIRDMLLFRNTPNHHFVPRDDSFVHIPLF